MGDLWAVLVAQTFPNCGNEPEEGLLGRHKLLILLVGVLRLFLDDHQALLQDGSFVCL